MSLVKYLTNIFSRSPVADGASAIGHEFDTTNTLTTTGAKLAAWSTGGTEKLAFTKDGGITMNSGATTAAHAQSLNLNWSSSGALTSSGQYSVVIGQNNRATQRASVAIGATNYVAGTASVALGELCTVSGDWSVALGLYAVVPHNSTVAYGGGFFQVAGDAQNMTSTLFVATTNATQTTLATYSAGRLVIPADTTWAFSALVIGRSDETDGNDSGAYRIEGCLTRDESSNTALVGSVTVTTIAESAGATAWDVTAEADDTNEALAIKVTGEASTNIRWVAKVDIAQVTYA